MGFISVATAMSLTRWSESTIRRRIADGSVTRQLEPGPNGRSLVGLASVHPYVQLELDELGFELVQAADAGCAEAQTDLALEFLQQDYPKGAMYWLELAVKQNYASAMYYLGRCYIDGTTVDIDENVGLIWILKAAVRGHPIAAAQMQSIRERLIAPAIQPTT